MGASKSAGGSGRSQPVNFAQPGMFSPNPGSSMGTQFGRPRMRPGYGFRPGGGRVQAGGPGGLVGGGTSFNGFPGYTPPSPPSFQPTPSPFQQPARNSFADLYGQPRSTPTGGYNPMQDMYGSFGQVQQPMPGYFNRYNIPGGYNQPGGGQPAPYLPPAQFNPVYTPRPDTGVSPSAPTAPGSDYQAGIEFTDSGGPTGYYPGPTPGETTPPPTTTYPDHTTEYGASVLDRAAEAGVPPEVIVAQDQQQQDPNSTPEVNVGTFDPTAPQGGNPTQPITPPLPPSSPTPPSVTPPPPAAPPPAAPVTPPLPAPPLPAPPAAPVTPPAAPVTPTAAPVTPPLPAPPASFSPGGYYPSSPQYSQVAPPRFNYGRGRGFAPILNYSPQRYFGGY